MTICKRLFLFIWDLSRSFLTCGSLLSSHVTLSNWDCNSDSAAFSKDSANRFSLPFCIIFLCASFFFCSLFGLICFWKCLFRVASRAYFAKRSTTRATQMSLILSLFFVLRKLVQLVTEIRANFTSSFEFELSFDFCAICTPAHNCSHCVHNNLDSKTNLLDLFTFTRKFILIPFPISLSQLSHSHPSSSGLAVM